VGKFRRRRRAQLHQIYPGNATGPWSYPLICLLIATTVGGDSDSMLDSRISAIAGENWRWAHAPGSQFAAWRNEVHAVAAGFLKIF
jgi:hypothetical protein